MLAQALLTVPANLSFAATICGVNSLADVCNSLESESITQLSSKDNLYSSLVACFISSLASLRYSSKLSFEINSESVYSLA
ncbi:hypothetical protein D3C71_1381680 [compost metagenome]